MESSLELGPPPALAKNGARVIALGGLGIGTVARWIPPRRIGAWAALINAAQKRLGA